MLIMKFGGSSVESAAAIERVAEIVRQRAPGPVVVVVSAIGKTTNRLLELAREAANGQRQSALVKLDDLRAQHFDIADHFGATHLIDQPFAELAEIVRGLAVLGELTPRSLDAVASYGERLSSVIVAQALGARHADARDYLVTDERHTQAAPLYEATYSRLSELPKAEVTVMGGFIGATAAGVTSTLGRGGSDFTASIVGAGLKASEIQIWTDVDGMLTADPRVFSGGHRVKTISFAEAAELAYFGAKVLHPSTVLPAMEKGIPVSILNSRRPEVEGTRIVAHAVPCRNAVKSIACKTNITLVNIASTRMLMAHGFLRRIFEVFDRYETPVDMLATSEVSVSLTIDTVTHLPAIVREIEEIADVTVETAQAIVSLVGENIRHTPGVAARLFTALGPINVRMISQGASRMNLSLVVAESDLRKAVESLHAEFFRELDPEVFA
ncbi:MAG: lysine-sensitive aspartokinase 3 [Bryobacteraceae bacterium]|nr:lysine-sensitive aspartokinase 3 [Bryobacteraceae bacterium]